MSETNDAGLGSKIRPPWIAFGTRALTACGKRAEPRWNLESETRC
ncbi:hypothetical protein BRSPCE3_12910 [Bradyrhizobium sp. Ce-3]|nr:hypothetical protein BRSPCE3_12910 [Bradyrhizobium sp. Ce-3]